MTPAELVLAGEFPAATRADWQALVDAVLRKSGADGLPVNTTYDGITLAPLYTQADAIPSPVQPHRGRWDVRQWHADPDPSATNAAVLADLEHGVTSLWLVLGASGLAVDALPVALDGVYLDLAPVVLDAGADFAAAASVFLELCGDRQPGGNLGADPLGLRASTGVDADLAGAATLAVRVARDFPGLRAIVVDGLPYHEAGGSDAQELGCSLAAAVAYLRALTDAGLDNETAAGQLEFRLAATADQFLTIAKFRAARRLWARVAEACGIPEVAQRQHAVTSPAMLTRRDPWVNMLRGTVACFAAGVGGADAITVLPFDSALGLPDTLGRRVARNTQSVLLDESTVAGVTDPAGQSWYVERLTEELAQAAWAWFTELERAGGLTAALDSGLVGSRLAETWRARRENLESGADKITGVTVFPNPDERPLVREPAPPPRSGGLPKVRYSEDFE